MPSIPQSLLWISLVVLWLFVLVPMLINKRDTVRRTSDVALATRVLNRGVRSRLLKRGGPAAGHRHDPEWQREDTDFEAGFEEFDGEDDTAPMPVVTHTRSVMVLASVTEEIVAEPEYLDVDVVDETSGALPVGDSARGVQASLFDTPSAEEAPEPEAVVPGPAAEEQTAPMAAVEDETVQDDAVQYDAVQYEYEYVDDTSGLEAEDEAAPAPRRSRRGESDMAAVVSARKYQFRKRVLTVMAVIMVLTAVLSFTVSSALWWTCGTTATVTVLYLAYLRRQTRIEEQVRRRRQQRTARSGRMDRRDDRMDDEMDRPMSSRRIDRDYDAESSRLRSGAVALEIDDEDPVFEHLDEMPYSRRYDLPRAAGQ